MFKDLFKKLKNVKNVELIVAALLCVVVVVLVVVSSTNTAVETSTSFAQYTQTVEKRVEKSISAIEGVRSVSVSVTFSGGVEQVFAYEKTTKTNGDVTTVTEQLITSGGSPVLLYEIAPKVAGVVVVIKGGNAAVVEYKARKAILALLGVEGDSVQVFVNN